MPQTLVCEILLAAVIGGEPLAREVQAAVRKSLPFLQAGAVAWAQERSCVSCHRVSFTVWALTDARRQGLEIDSAFLGQWDRWALEFCCENTNQAGARDGGGLDTMVQMILARKQPPADPTERSLLAGLVDLIVAEQQPDGHWNAGGQLPLQRRPKSETDEVTTMWTVLALAALAVQPESQRQAIDWLDAKKTGAGVSTEWLAVRLLLEMQRGREHERFLDRLIANANPGGGWGWLLGEPSDALGTGLGLYALAKAGSDGDDPVVRSAWKFLIDTQTADGSWTTPTTKRKGKGPQSTEISNYWGTSWAVIGLGNTLPRSGADHGTFSKSPGTNDKPGKGTTDEQ